MDLAGQFHEFGLIALAGGLGALIGLERELADKPAGLRTHILVGSGCALLVVVANSLFATFQQQGDLDAVEVDPTRIIQAIVVGISFLGAGTIIRRGEAEVEGLTTAASILLTASIAIAVVSQRAYLAMMMTALVVAVLLGLGSIQNKLFPHTPNSKNNKPPPA